MANILTFHNTRKMRSVKVGEIRRDMYINMYNILNSYTSTTYLLLPPLSLLSLLSGGLETREMRKDEDVEQNTTHSIQYVGQNNIRTSWNQLEKTIIYNR